MATFVVVNSRLYVGQLDVTANANNVSFGPMKRTMVPCTTLNDGGYDCVLPGLISGSVSFSGYQDFAAGGLDATINGGSIGSQFATAVVPNPTGTITAGDPCWLTRGVLSAESPLSGAPGEMAAVSMEFATDTAVVQGKVLHPAAARTATGTGTAVAMTGPTASQKLYAGLHVTAWSGLTNVVFKIQTDDNSGFTSATDRITFTTVTGLTSEWASVVGSFSSETHVRVSYTVTGTGSVTFAAFAGVV